MAIEHVDIVDPEIHEPKGAASAASGRVYVANGTGSGSWVEYPSATLSTKGIVNKAVDPVNLTENSGVVGGTNDGNLPSLATVSATYTQAEIVAIRDAVREVAAKLNDLMAKLRTAGVM